MDLEADRATACFAAARLRLVALTFVSRIGEVYARNALAASAYIGGIVYIRENLSREDRTGLALRASKKRFA